MFKYFKHAGTRFISKQINIGTLQKYQIEQQSKGMAIH